MLFHAALVSRTKKLDASELATVASAIQKQVLRDFGPIWQIQATVDAFPRLEDVPGDYWVVTVEDFKPNGFPGVHSTRDFQPFARVAYSNVWSLVASHEVLEMLSDPFQSRRVAGRSPTDPGSRVEYLVEICDPCQDPAWSYSVNGVMVSDFVTPQFFEPSAAIGVRYSFNGAIGAPHSTADGGYLSWLDPATGHWFQEVNVGGQIQHLALNVQPATGMSLRERVNRASIEPRWWRGLAAGDKTLLRCARQRSGVRRTAGARARELRAQLAPPPRQRRRRT